MARLYANNAESTLAGNIGAGATSLTVATGDGAKFPSPSGGDYFDFTLEQGTTREIARCTARSGDVLTITRAVEAIAGVGAVAQAFTTGAIVAIRTTAASLNTFAAGLRDAPSGTYTPVMTTYAADFTAGARNLNQLLAYPVIVAETVALDRIGTYLSGVDSVNASAVVRFGIWAHDTVNNRPSTLLLDAGTVSVFSGSARFVEVTTSYTLEPGIYWFGSCGQGSANTMSTSGFSSTAQTVHMVPLPRTTAPSSGAAPSLSNVAYNSITGAFGNITTAPDAYVTSGAYVWLRHT